MLCTHPKSAGAQRCKPCSLKAKWADPHFRAKQAAGARKALTALRSDPAFMERQQARLAKGTATIHATKPHLEPEVLARRGRTFSARRLGWCPPYLRGAYRELLAKHFPAAEAREIILQQFDADLRARRAA